MDIVNLKAKTRIGKGKSYTRKTRKKGWIPAIYYGHNIESRKIEVNAKDFINLAHARKISGLINIDLPEEKGDTTSIIKEVQRNVLKDDVFYHIDFQHVAMDEKVTVECPIKLIGVAPGVKEGGILDHPLHSINVECLPGDIPQKIEVDISELGLGQSIHIRDLDVPNVVLKNPPEEVVAGVVHPQVVIEEEITEEEEEKAPEEEEKDKDEKSTEKQGEE